MTHTVEKGWITESGLHAVVTMSDHGTRCGYVGVPPGHSHYAKDYQMIDGDYDVHGGLTYSGASDNYPVASTLWWFGYDCAHAWDKPSDEYLEKNPDDRRWHGHDSIHRTLDYCIRECESLASELILPIKVENAEDFIYSTADSTARYDKLDELITDKRQQWQQDLIDATKAGKKIEWSCNAVDNWFFSSLNLFPDTYKFRTSPKACYRVSLEKVTRYLWAVKDDSGLWYTTTTLLSEAEFSVEYPSYINKRLDWSATVFEE